MKIAFIQHHNSPHVIKRALYLHSKGHEVFYFGFCNLDENLNLPAEIKTFEIKDSTIGGKFHAFNIIKRFLVSTFTITALAKKNKIDILIPMGLGYLPLCLFSRSKIVLEHMGSDILIYAQQSFAHRFFTRFLYLFCSGVFQDSYIAQEAGLKTGAPSENNIVAEVGVQTNFFNLKLPRNEIRKRYHLPEDALIVFSPRGYGPLYNIRSIFEAIPLVLKRYPNCYFVFTLKPEAIKKDDQDFIKDNQLQEHIFLTGFLKNTTELPLFYRDSNLAISIPSSDSSPLSVFEGIACGTTFIATDLPWINKKLIPGKHLHVIENSNPTTLANTIIDCFDKKSYFDEESLFEQIKLKCEFNTENEKVHQLLNKVLGVHRL